MKTLKVQNKEDCGVWLDTVQLKGNAKKKRSARPISKLLNPFANGAGYNVAVALNFTQTKIEMPKTKQSSISNFFTGQRRILNKMSTTDVPNSEQRACFPSVPTSVNAVKSTTGDFVDFVEKKRINDQPTEPVPKMWWEREEEEENQASSQNLMNDLEQSSVDKSLQMKRRIFEHDLQSSNCDNNVHQDSEPNFLKSLPSQIDFNVFEESLLNIGGRTSTQRTSKGLSLHINKENMTPRSPRKTIPGSQTHSVYENARADSPNGHNEGSKSPFKWTEPKSSPVKKRKWQSRRDSDDESLSMLFTQDSQGFRVIAHRSPTRSPFKDQTNANAIVPPQIKRHGEEEEEDDEEMLFTQDSQGNLVMKH